MKRRLLNLLTALSLLLFVSIAAAWVKVHASAAAHDRTYRAGRPAGGIMPAYSHEFGYVRLGLRTFFVGTYRSNVLALGWNTNAPPPPLGQYGWTPVIDYQGEPSDAIGPDHWRLWHFGALRTTVTSRSGTPVTYTSIVLPHWAALTLAAILPATRARRWYASARGRLRRWGPRLPGVCRACGYDLTGNQSGVCPECGADARATEPRKA